VGEFPEAAKESCEDITPPVAKDALESWIWEKAKVGFAPTGRIPSFEGWHRGLVARLPGG